MPPFLGLRGDRLNVAALLGVMMPSIVSFGYNQSLLGGVLTLNSFEQQFREIDVDDATLSGKGQKSTVQGTIVALYAVGGLFGALSCIGLGDLLGRRRVILVAALTQMAGAILMASAFDFVHLIIARLILGLGCGGLVATVPIWQSEISSPHKRGAHVATTGLFAGAGTSLSLFLDLGMSFAPGSVSWRFPFAFQVLFSIAIIGAISLMPESPRWLIQQNRTIEARKILAALEDVKPNDSKIDAEIQAIQLSLKLSGEGSLGQIFQMGPQRIFHRAMLAASVMLFLQLTGVNVITFFTNTIFEQYLRLDSVTSRVLAASYQLVSLIGGTFCIFTVEAFGRRGLMLAGATGNAICLALVAGLGSQPTNKVAMHAAVVFIFLYHFTFIIGFGGVAFLYVGEIAPLKMRATINGISVGTFWALNVLIAEITPIAFNAISWHLFIIFAGLNAVMVVLVYFLIPETAGRSLEEVDQIFVSSKSIWDSVWVARRFPRSVPEEFQKAAKHDLENCP
ncbi:hypothetical protein PMG11_00270 [Penicillium brasilianum]|uniref:Major facilitator superfamily (MFS) profile domain-containing protein n=1 Tax=Penicillium brasilianum TaxID=104259 RepID=A0A0F7TBK5_PENBI|nr:hypothetical protein PMG11_00270 [Penicillium brasilianum]